VLDELRADIEAHGVEILVVSDFTIADLSRTWWAKTPAGSPGVLAELERVASGDVEYVALRAPTGQAVARGCVNYVDRPNVGTISQLSTKQAVRNLGIGTRLLHAIEERILARGCSAAMLAVRPHNEGAQRLYRRLGYERVGERVASWMERNPDGTQTLRTPLYIDLRKDLSI
jgi:ribosomal protein S18 acetylase RimI-like enzyme